jgi:hypothetical protein
VKMSCKNPWFFCCFRFSLSNTIPFFKRISVVGTHADIEDPLSDLSSAARRVEELLKLNYCPPMYKTDANSVVRIGRYVFRKAIS